MKRNEYEIMYRLENHYWWFIGKTYLIDECILRIDGGLSTKDRLLDVGCGTGRILELLGSYDSHAFGVDLSLDALAFSRVRVPQHLVCADMNKRLPFKDDTFRLITCLDVLEHMDGDEWLLSEIERVCKPGGQVIVTVPACKLLWSFHDLALHHRKRYVKKEILNMLQKDTLTINKISYFNTVLFFPILVVRKLSDLFKKNQNSRSDFSIPVPNLLNKALTLLYKVEIFFLRFFNFPFGVSLLCIFQKKRP
jgi:ubiquinone/menaquinone biosynthesis C-methylase UbiE